MSYDVEHLFIDLYTICISSLVKYLLGLWSIFLMMPWILNAIIWSCSHSALLLTLSSTSSSLLPSILFMKFLVTSHAQHTGSIPSWQPVQTLSKEQSPLSLQTLFCFQSYPLKHCRGYVSRRICCEQVLDLSAWNLGLGMVQTSALWLLTYAFNTLFLICHLSYNVCCFILLYKHIYLQKTCIWSWIYSFPFRCIYFSGLCRISFSA